MAEEKSKAQGSQTPVKRRRQRAKVIGSSCTWNRTELQNFKVEYDSAVMDPWSMFDHPERWFGAPKWEEYLEG